MRMPSQRVNPAYAFSKRALDLAVALLGLIVLSPVMLLTAVAVWATLGRPVLFRQKRPGRYGTPFTIVKFCTMRSAFDPDGVPLPDGERLTRLGRFLRTTSLDELPQLWNVLRGEMSLVGPRPLLLEYLPLYTPEQARRHEVRPGLTGWAQVKGRNAVGWTDRFRLDVWYVDNRSMTLDLTILLMTVWTVFAGDGVHQRGHATAERFTGSG